MITVTFRFYEELNDFLPPERRWHAFPAPCARAATTKHMIEALGVPHTEVDLILVNGESSGFDYLLRDGDRVSVYPRFETLDIAPLLRVRRRPLRVSRFIADAHLGGLAHLLRMAGFDTLYRNDYTDREIAQIAAREGRIVLTRDRDLLKHRNITHGCYLHAIKPAQQFCELVQRLDLARSMRPCSRCLRCNAPLHRVARKKVLDRLPPSVRINQTRFTTCPLCHRVYWKGSHWQRMQSLVMAPSSPAAAPTARGVPGPDEPVG